MSILFLLIVLFIFTMPVPAMWLQWHIDPTIKSAYVKPWKLDQLDHNSRAYHQHLVNHALIGLCAVLLAMGGSLISPWLFYVSIPFFLIGKIYPIWKEFYWDPKILHKPQNYLDWHERLAGDLITLPLYVIAVVLFFK